LPIDCTVNLDNVEELIALTDSPNNAFLQFAGRYLSRNKNDNGHHSAIKSCMLRVSHSLNSKYREAGMNDAEDTIIERWEVYRPDYRLLLGHFYADL
jgi:hypothetical protein